MTKLSYDSAMSRAGLLHEVESSEWWYAAEGANGDSVRFHLVQIQMICASTLAFRVQKGREYRTREKRHALFHTVSHPDFSVDGI